MSDAPIISIIDDDEFVEMRYSIGLYKFVYNGGHRAYVGVIARRCKRSRPRQSRAVATAILRAVYQRIGLNFQIYDAWVATARAVHRATH